jgi:hypothetical protein
MILCAAEQMCYGCDNGPKPACGTRPTNLCDDMPLTLVINQVVHFVVCAAMEISIVRSWYGICWEGAGCISPSSTLKTLQRTHYTFTYQAVVNGLKSSRNVFRLSRQKAKVPVKSSESVRNSDFSTGKFDDGKVANNNMAMASN